jgi:hypothetical protein
MSGTPIFEQLCRDYADAGRIRPMDATQSAFSGQPTVPAIPVGFSGGGLVYERSGYPPIARPEWAHPGD